jgi:hypothetical protein
MLRHRCLEQLAAARRDPEFLAHQRLSRRGPEQHDHLGADELDLLLEPGQAGADLASAGFLVHTQLALRDPFEMLHDVRDVRVASLDPGVLHRPIEHPTGRADERMAVQVLFIARLLADEHDARLGRSLTEHRLGRVLVERAATTRLHRFPHRRKCEARREELERADSVRSTAITIQHTTMFVPLHVKSEHSLGHGTSSVDALVRRAVGLGFRALALTDVENLHGQVKFHHAARAHGLRAITGVELRSGYGPRSPGRRPGRLILLARDRGGYASLCRSSAAVAPPQRARTTIRCAAFSPSSRARACSI